MPEHHCKIPAEETEAAAAANRSWIPYSAADPTVSQCFVYENLTFGNATLRCSDVWNDWEYSGDVTESIVSKVCLVGSDLICSTGHGDSLSNIYM